MIGTYRSEERPGLPSELPLMKSMILSRFGTDEITQLSRSMLGETANQSHIVNFLEKETEGNALFLVEVVRSLAEQWGSLDMIGVHQSFPDSILPQGIEALLRRRIGRVPIEHRPLLDASAVAGRQLDLNILRHFADDNDALDQWLLDCSYIGILTLNNEQWQFSHDKLRDVALQDLTDEALLSRQVAQVIEIVYPDDVDTHERLYHLWHRAGDIDKALIYLHRFTNRLLVYTGNSERTLILCQRAMAMLPTGDVRRIDFLDIMAFALTRPGKYELGQSAAETMFTLAQQHDDRYHIGASVNAPGDAGLGNRPIRYGPNVP